MNFPLFYKKKVVRVSKVVLKISSWFVCLLTFAVISGCANPDVSVGAGEGGSLGGDPAEQVEELKEEGIEGIETIPWVNEHEN